MAWIRDARRRRADLEPRHLRGRVGISVRILFDESAITFYMTGTSAVHQVIAHPAIPGSMPLAAIVSALCLRAGLTEDDLDVYELTEGVRGYVLAHQASVHGALETLAAAYMFDHKLKFKKRGRTSSRLFPEKDLVPVPLVLLARECHYCRRPALCHSWTLGAGAS